MNLEKVPQGNKKEKNSSFSEETRKQLSDDFIKLLEEEKEAVKIDVEHIRGIIGDASVEAYRNLMIFNRALQKFSEDTRIPEKYRLVLRVHQNNLSPIGAMEIVTGIDSYQNAIQAVLGVLNKILTEEVSLAVHAYAKKIFLPPAQDYVRKGPKPFGEK